MKMVVLTLVSSLLLSSLGPAALADDTFESGQSSPTLFFYQLKNNLMQMGSPLVNDPVQNQAQFNRELLNIEEHLDGRNNTNGLVFKTRFQENLEKYNTLTGLFGELDSFGTDFGQKLVKYIADDKVVTGYHLHLLSKIFISYHMMGFRTQEFVFLYNPFQSNQSVTLIDPNNMAKTKENLIWLSASSMMYDKFLRAYELYYTKEGAVRRILKHVFKVSEHTKDLAEELQMMVKGSLGKKNREILTRYINIYLKEKAALTQLAQNDQELASLLKTFDKNLSLQRISQGENIKLKGYSVVDGLAELGENIVYGVSKVFGNIAGAMRFRRGYMENNVVLAEELKGKLKPLDILFEKTPFALTDTFIPGYFGHAAVWLGTEQELKELGMWDHPSIIPYHDRITLGYSIVEALRPGVSMNTVRGFLNIDHIAILRVKNVLEDKVELPDIYYRTMKNIGGQYDFNFDVATTDRIVCSELPYQAFGKIKFPTKPRLGRETIEPDLVAEVNYYDNSPLEFVTFMESFSKTRIDRLKESDLGQRLGFELNQERSTKEDLKFDRVTTTCRTVRVRNTRYAMGSTTFDRRNETLKRVCTTKREAITYKAPELLVDNP